MNIKYLISALMLTCTHIAGAADSPSKALSIYQNSSTEIRSEQISAQIKKNFSSMGMASSPESKALRKKILGAIDSAYNPQRFEKHVMYTINKTLNPSEQQKIINWFNTPLGRKAALAEAVAMIESYEIGMPAVIDKARKKSLPRQTSKLIEIVEMASMEADLQLDVSIYQTSASSFAANAPQSEAGTSDYRLFYSATSGRRNEIAKVNNSYSLAFLSLAFDGFSDQELKALISFWGSPTGSRFAFATREGINRAFKQASSQLNKEVAHIIANSRMMVAGNEG